jgi:hypothetical protein
VDNGFLGIIFCGELQFGVGADENVAIGCASLIENRLY